MVFLNCLECCFHIAAQFGWKSHRFESNKNLWRETFVTRPFFQATFQPDLLTFQFYKACKMRSAPQNAKASHMKFISFVFPSFLSSFKFFVCYFVLFSHGLLTISERKKMYFFAFSCLFHGSAQFHLFCCLPQSLY